MPDKRISSVIRRIVAMLVNGDYSGLEKLSNGTRLTADEIAQAINDYGARLIMPPDDAFENVDIIEVEEARAKKWSVRFDLWTTREGKSDLTLELTVIDVGPEEAKVEIDNIHVL